MTALRLFLLPLLFLLFSPLFGALPAPIQALLNDSKLPSEDVSIYIKALDSGEVVASHYADRMRRPASVVKVMTTYASLLKLGFEYRIPTEFYITGRIERGSVDGDLVIKGYGDPTFSSEHLSRIARQIAQKGIREITGSILIDRSYFEVGDAQSSHFDNYTYSAYNAMPDAVMFNEHTSTVCITPRQASVHKALGDPAYRLVNKIEFVNRACRGKYAWVNSAVGNRNGESVLTLKGKLSKRCGERKVCKIVTKPYKSLYYALKKALREQGVVVRGGMRLQRVPRRATLLLRHYSAPLEQIVSKTAKKSNNLYARHLLLHLGAKMYGAPATLSKGRKAILRLLSQVGVIGEHPPYIENGSGLSRMATLSARQLSRLYESAYQHFGMRWLQTLSIAGVDGTIKKRFRGKPAEGRAWMKTGTLKHVKNIGGYVQSRGGRYYSVVVLVNTTQKRYYGAKLQNDIINYLAMQQTHGVSVAHEQTPPNFHQEEALDLW